MPKRFVLLLLWLVAGDGAASEWLGSSVPIVPDVYNSGAFETAPHEDAQAVFDQAQSAAESNDLTTAFALATKAVRLDPTHSAARRVLGYELTNGEWLTPYHAKQRERGFAWDARYGWFPERYKPRYEAGERRAGRRWIDAATDASIHAEIENGWQVRTDHFVVQTNHSLASGARLAAELESLWQAWRQMFAGYWLEPGDAQRLFAGERVKRGRQRLMRVFYHRDKQGYVEHLRRRQPRIGETLGIYFDDRREAHFYHTDDPEEADLLRATLYHEAAHQLFAETRPGRPGAGRDANFWLVEGVACYFEMLWPVEGEARFQLGDPAQGRLPSAVARGPVAPLAELAALGQSDLQRQENLAAWYAQAAGVVTMLRHGDSADPRALDQMLRAVYGGRPGGGRPGGSELQRQTGRTFSELDRDYNRFLANLSR